MSLRLLADDEIALTPGSSPGQALSLSHRNRRGNFSIPRAPDLVLLSYPRPLAGEGRRVREGTFLGFVVKKI
jgi:hypothetical protein